MSQVVKAGIVMVGLSALAAAGIVFVPLLSAGESAAPTSLKTQTIGARGSAVRPASPSAATMAKADRKLAAAMAAEPAGGDNALSQISRVVGAPSSHSVVGLPAGMAGGLAFAAAERGGDATGDLIARAKRELLDGAAPSARLLLQRAARSGAVEALTLLGASYDATALKEMGVSGVRGDAAAARKFYKEAADKGSAEAKRRLARL